MKRADAVLRRVILAAGLGIAASTAHAVPIVLDFTGTVTNVTGSGGVTDWSSAGQSVTGRIVIETEGLITGTLTNSYGTTVTYADVADSVDLLTSELSIAGVAYDIDANIHNNGGVTLHQVNEGADDLSITNTSRGYWAGAPIPMPSEFLAQYLTMTWRGSGATSDFIDLTDFEVLDLVPLLTMVMPTGFYSELTYQCGNGTCSNTGYTQTNFLINSLTAHTPGVPEPGTLALFAVGLLGGAVARRSAVKGR